MSISFNMIEEAWFDKTKAGKALSGWKKRFFVLNLESKVISYFSDEAKTDKKGACVVYVQYCIDIFMTGSIYPFM